MILQKSCAGCLEGFNTIVQKSHAGCLEGFNTIVQKSHAGDEKTQYNQAKITCRLFRRLQHDCAKSHAGQ